MGIRQLVDEHAVTELRLYIDNTGEFYPQKQLIVANLAKKVAKGKYDPAKAFRGSACSTPRYAWRLTTCWKPGKVFS